MITYPTKFQQIYQCFIGKSGEKLYKVPLSKITAEMVYNDEIRSHHCEDEVIIKMPESEYHRFTASWNMYMNMMAVAEKSPEFKEEFVRLMAMADIYS